MIEFLTLGMHPVAFLAVGVVLAALHVAWMWYDFLRSPNRNYREDPEGAWFVALVWTLAWPWALLTAAFLGSLFLAYAGACGFSWCIGAAVAMVRR